MVLKYEDIKPTNPAPGITRRILAHGGKMMGVEASLRKGRLVVFMYMSMNRLVIYYRVHSSMLKMDKVSF